MYDGYFLDLDGVLIDTERLGLASFLATGRDHGVEIDAALYLALVGVSASEGMQRFRAGLSGLVEVDPFLADWRRAFRRAIETSERLVLPGAPELLARVRGTGRPVVLVTNSTRESAEWKVERAGLGAHFDRVVTSDDVARGKPAPDIYLFAAERVGADPARSLAIEDSGHGVEAAVAAGMSVLQVPHIAGSPPRVGLRVQSIASLSAALDLLEGR